MNRLPFIIFALLLVSSSCQEESDTSNTTTEIVNQTNIAQGELPKTSPDKNSQDQIIEELINESTSKFNENENVSKLQSEVLTTEKEEVSPPKPIMEELAIPDEPMVELVDVIDETFDFHAYNKLNTFLSTYVTYSGNVNYSSIKSNKSELTEIIKEFEDNYPDPKFSYTQKLTYWINAYNVYTIKLIVDNYPTSSITKITAKPWHKKFIKLGGKTYSLNNIENDIIRAQFNEPRIHFALNCASKSCPVLLNKAYTPKKLYGQLTSQTKRFLKDTSKNNFSGSTIKISKIFDWYGADFRKNGNTVIDFFNKYRTKQLSNPKIGYMEYSWDLNK